MKYGSNMVRWYLKRYPNKKIVNYNQPKFVCGRSNHCLWPRPSLTAPPPPLMKYNWKLPNLGGLQLSSNRPGVRIWGSLASCGSWLPWGWLFSQLTFLSVYSVPSHPHKHQLWAGPMQILNSDPPLPHNHSKHWPRRPRAVQLPMSQLSSWQQPQKSRTVQFPISLIYGSVFSPASLKSPPTLQKNLFRCPQMKATRCY